MMIFRMTVMHISTVKVLFSALNVPSGDTALTTACTSYGMTEGWPNGDGEKQLETLLSGINGISPSEMAGILLRFAIEQRGGRIRDDMTVLCAGIWEKGEGI